MRNIIELPNDPLKLIMTTFNGKNCYVQSYSTNNGQNINNFSFENDLVFKSFHKMSRVNLDSLDGLSSFIMTYNDFSKLLSNNQIYRIIDDKLVFTCRYVYTTRWGRLYIKPLGI